MTDLTAAQLVLRAIADRVKVDEPVVDTYTFIVRLLETTDEAVLSTSTDSTLIEQQAEQIAALTGAREDEYRMKQRDLEAWRRVIVERDKAESEVAVLQAERDLYHATGVSMAGQVAAIVQESKALRKVIEDAPHEKHCAWLRIEPGIPEHAWGCTCWKSKALPEKETL